MCVCGSLVDLLVFLLVVCTAGLCTSLPKRLRVCEGCVWTPGWLGFWSLHAGRREAMPLLRHVLFSQGPLVGVLCCWQGSSQLPRAQGHSSVVVLDTPAGLLPGSTLVV